jgi:hypothetical protein
MKRLACALSLLLLGAPGAATAARSAHADVCVGGAPGCFSTLQDAVDAAQDGDTIHVGAGTFAGGVTIDVSVTIEGRGPGKTVISGGGPVLTIGQVDATSEPTVTIEGVTITGGVNTSMPSTFQTHGGGIFVPPAAGPAAGATVTIRSSVVTGNGVAPTSTSESPSGVHCPGGSFCPYALAAGGGISNDGNMTMDDTIVSGNRAGTVAGVGPLASDVEGGGIWTSANGSLTLTDSIVRDNTAAAVPPNGRFGDGGGIFAGDGATVTVRDSTVSDNSAVLTSTFPYDVGGGYTLDLGANGGGIHASDDGSMTIDDTRISDNTVSGTDLNAEPVAIDAGLSVGIGSLAMDDSVVSGNRAIGTVGTTADVGEIGSAFEIDGSGTIRDTRITGNTTTVSSPTGIAGAGGAVFTADQADRPVVFIDSVVSGNVSTASSPAGSATLQGAGITNAGGPLRLLDTQVTGNAGIVSGPSGFAQGGGIWSGDLFGGLPATLLLRGTAVTRNTLTASPGLQRQGGGLYTLGSPVTLRDSRIANNAPDQCDGC